LRVDISLSIAVVFVGRMQSYEFPESRL
jgi:hypothetical protein